MDKNNIVQQAEFKVKKYFELVDEIKEYNQEKVLKAFYNHKIYGILIMCSCIWAWIALASLQE